MNPHRAIVERLIASLLFVLLLAPLGAAAEQKKLSSADREVTGIMLGLEGAPGAVRGESLAWFFTLYEVVGRDQLRPARSGTLRVSTSLRPDEPAVVLSTDARGRAEIKIPVPEDAVDFNVNVAAVAGRFRRSFEMEAYTISPEQIELIADRPVIQPGETVTFVGRAVSLPSDRPDKGRQVLISFTDRDGRALSPKRTVKIGESGAFTVSTTAPPNVSRIKCVASVKGFAQSSETVEVRRLTAPHMVVRALPEKQIAAPGENVSVEVTVRRGDGRPVRGAAVRLGDDTSESDKKDIETDASGRALIQWTAPRFGSGDIKDMTADIRVTRPWLKDAWGRFSVRVAREPFHTAVSVEGGALLPGLPSRVYVRMTRADGTPARGIRVKMSNPLLGAFSGITGDDGIAVFEGRPKVRTGIEGRDRCGGTTSSLVSVSVDKGEDDETSVFERCVPVDPDGTVRVRPNKIATKPEETLSLRLFVAPAAAAAPVELMLLKVESNGEFPPDLIPMSRRIIEASGRTRRTPLKLPKGMSGEFLIRARPLIGSSLTPVRGGTASVFSLLGEPVVSAVRTEGRGAAHLSISAPGDKMDGAALLVPADEADDLEARLQALMLPSAFRRLGVRTSIAGRLLEGLSAARAILDDAAPAVLRNKIPKVAPAPEYPTSVGLLRDPVRAGARYVRGRLALAVRTLEKRLEDASPKRIGDVGFPSPRGGTFNREALNAVKGTDFIEMPAPMTLGGAPLTLRELERADPFFTFDNMARRVTRKRLMSLLVRLRSFVRERELDLRRDGRDPAQWLDVLKEEIVDMDDDCDMDDHDMYDDCFGSRLLFDGWGKQMAVRPVSKKQGELFDLFNALPPGFALVSAGPDGRFGSADDMVDPFARVLPSGGIYAQAVGEDELLARLNRLEIHRATLEATANVFDDPAGEVELGDGDVPDVAEGWNDVPQPLNAPNPVDYFERKPFPVERSEARLIKAGGDSGISFTVGDEPRRWSLIAAAWSADGRASLARHDFSAGVPIVLDAEPLQRLAPNEPLLLPVIGARLPGGPEKLTLSVQGKGVVRAELETGGVEGNLAIGAGGGFEARVRVFAEQEGSGAVRIEVRDPSGRIKRAVELPLDVKRPGLLRKLYAAAAVSKSTGLRLDIPKDAAAPDAALILAAPDALLHDPVLAKWMSEDPALIAWALAVLGRPIPDDLLRRLEAATLRTGKAGGELLSLSTACAAAAWAAAEKTDAAWAPSATRNAVSREKTGDERRKLSIDAAILAALSTAIAPGSQSASTLESIQRDLKNSIRRFRDDPAFLARGAAALLLVDRRDIRGRTMLTLAEKHLVKGFQGGLTVDVALSDDPKKDKPVRGGAEQTAATAALAVAAHQVGDDALARDLARGLASEATSAAKLGGETLFWLLAARAFGVFGIIGKDNASKMTVSLGDGPPRSVELSQKPVIIPLENLGPGDSSSIRIEPQEEASAVPLAYASATYVRPARKTTKGPLQAKLTGDAGFAGERAAFVASVSNTSAAPMERPVLFVSFPAGADLDEDAAKAVRRNKNVISVDAPGPRGVVRVRLKPLSPGENVKFPIPLHWSAGGPRAGLALAAFPEDKAWELTVVPPRELDIPFRPVP